MKTIIIRLPDVEAAMLMELQSKRNDLRDFSGYLARLIRKEYQSVRR
jgi:hypothetical protein